MLAAPFLADVLSHRLDAEITLAGEPQPTSPTGWDQELAVATPALREMATHYDMLLTATVQSRCLVDVR
ncbi:hypothetical protein GCM10027403_26910 [Arthrobacter tecti]